jgi:hypothetical protein
MLSMTANELAAVCGGQQVPDSPAMANAISVGVTALAGTTAWTFGTPLAAAIATKLGAGPKPFHWHPATKTAVFVSGLGAGVAATWGMGRLMNRINRDLEASHGR